MDNQFDSKGGGQNIAQGDHAIGKQENATQEVRGHGNISSGTGNVTVNKYGVPYEAYGELAGKYAVTESALASFFKILEEQQVPLSDLDSKLREIAIHYRALLELVKEIRAKEQIQNVMCSMHIPEQQLPEHHCALHDKGAWSIDPLTAMWCAITAGNYSKAEVLLKKFANDYFSFEDHEFFDLHASLQCVQLHYANAAEYWQHSASISGRPVYLNKANYALQRIAHWSEALPLWIESLMIYHRISDKRGEAVTSWNIGCAYEKQGDLANAEQYISQAVQLAEEIGHRKLKEWRKHLAEIRAQLLGK